MRLSTKCRYGTRALLEIGRNYGHGPVKRKDIAKAQELSRSYIENILITLKSKKILKTTRGADGGFELLRMPAQINLYQVVTALEGSIAPVDCVEHENTCNRDVKKCVARRAWLKLHEAQVAALTAITLQHLLDWEKEDSKTLNYAI